jgi:hypothetical protein
MNEIFYKKEKNGFITLEILIAFVILIINITSVMLIINAHQLISVNIKMHSLALYKVESLLEETKSEAKFDFNLINPINLIYDDIYQKSLSVEQINLFTKKIVGKIIWKNQNQVDQQIEIASLLTNPNAIDGGETCSSVLQNKEDWKNPNYYFFSSVDLLNSGINGFTISDIDVFNGKIYISSANTQISTDDSFFIFDKTDNPQQMPIFLGSLDNNNKSKSGLSAIKITKNYAYVANAYTGSSPSCLVGNNCAQFQVIDITEPTNPSIILSANLKIPTITSSGKLASGISIYYDRGYVYLGLTKAISGPEFNIIDVGGGGPPASPINPIWKSGYVVGNGINSIFVKNNFAYIASPNNQNLIVLDISNPSSPSLVNSFTPDNLPETSGVGSNHGKDVYVVGHDVYLGRTYGPKEFYILDNSQPQNIVIKGLPLDIGLGNRTSINRIIIKDDLAFFITPDKFHIWNIHDPENIIPWNMNGDSSSFLSFDSLGGAGITGDCEGDYLYLGLKSIDNNDLLIIATPKT